jgi:hypothetical protein
MTLPPLVTARLVTLSLLTTAAVGLDVWSVASAGGLGVGQGIGPGGSAAGGVIEAAIGAVAGSMRRRRGFDGGGPGRPGSAGRSPVSAARDAGAPQIRFVEAAELRAMVDARVMADARQMGPGSVRASLHRAMGLGPPPDRSDASLRGSGGTALEEAAGALYDLAGERVLLAAATADVATTAAAATNATVIAARAGDDDAAARRIPAAGSDLAPFVLCHALALQILDRHFHLGTFLRDGQVLVPPPGPPVRARRGGTGLVDPDDGDAAVARQALVEGDALIQALEQILPDGMPSARGVRLAADRARATVLSEPEDHPGRGGPHHPDQGIAWARRLFPQTAGVAFVAALRARWSWAELDRALWVRPPASTEEVLHPDAYLRGEVPDPVAARLPLAALGDWRVAAEDTLGELGIAAFLGPSVGAYRATRAAAGWAGDRAVWLSPSSSGGGEPFAVWITTWDDETDAEDFAEQATLALVRLTESAPAAEPAALFVDRAGRRFAIETAPRTVGLLFSAPEAGQAILQRLVAAAVPVTTASASLRARARIPEARLSPRVLAAPGAARRR